MSETDRQAAENPDFEGSREMLDAVYDELKRRAKSAMRSLPPGQTIQATALVHEAWVRVSSGSKTSNPATSKDHFLSMATIALRNVVVDHVRAKHRLKRGGQNKPEALQDDVAAPEVAHEIRIAIHAAVEELRGHDPRLADMVVMRFFLGMTETETAAKLEISERTVRRDWTYARSWLASKLGDLIGD